MSSDKPPREWWMEARPYSTEDWVWVGYTGGPNNPSAIRTIEYSAYQAVVAERDQLRRENERLNYQLACDILDKEWPVLKERDAAVAESAEDLLREILFERYESSLIGPKEWSEFQRRAKAFLNSREKKGGGL